MGVHQQKKISISLLIPFIVFILFFSIMIWQKYRISHEMPPVASPPVLEGSRSVTLFFSDNETHLARETREIEACDDEETCLKSVLDELMNGPVGDFLETVPEGTTVNEVSIENDNAIIDLNQTFVDGMLSGSSAEMIAVYSIVNTVASNFPKLQKVKLTVEGKLDVILHHLDLSDPLEPDYSLEKASSPEPGKSSGGATKNNQGESK